MAVVQHASVPNEGGLACCRAGLVDRLHVEGIGSPAIITVGNVAQGLQRLLASAPAQLGRAA